MSGEIEHAIIEWIGLAALAIESIAVLLIVGTILWGTIRYLHHVLVARGSVETRFATYKVTLGRALLLGLEILVAADIVKTVALETTLESVAVLGLLVLVRIFLGWSLIVEMEGRWPWQKRQAGEASNVEQAA